MITIYAVNVGQYSDYRVVALFSARQGADDFMAVVKDDYNAVDTYELDPPIVYQLQYGYRVWSVYMRRDGTSEEVEAQEIDGDSIGAIGQHYIWRRSTIADAYRKQTLADVLTSHVLAKTKKQAIKIVNQQRTQMIAEGKWELEGIA